MRLVGQPLGGETRITGRQRRRLGLLLRHLHFGLGEVGPVVVGLEEVDVPVEGTVGPRVAQLLQGLATLRPQPLEIDRADLGLDLDDLAVDRPLVGEDVTDRAALLDRADAHTGDVEIGLAQEAFGHARSRGKPRLQVAIVLQDKLSFVLDRHANLAIMAAQTLDDLPTPALILDRAVLRRNLKRMSERLRNAGVMLRPHLKTAKSIEVGRMAVEGHDGRITVSTLAEARYFADGGFKDILYGVGVVPSKLPAVAGLRRRGVNLRVVTDNLVVARAIADAAKNGDTFSVLIEIDSGGGRAGLPSPALPGILEIARILHGTPGVELAGVMTHAGHSYHESTPDGIAAVAEQERQAIVGAAAKLRAAGIPCPIVSAGSTPTAMHSRDFTGITEMRPGVYVFNDLDQEYIGSCAPSDLALSVLASVIGHYPHRNQMLVDAGALALSKDISAQEFKPQVGYGTIVDAPAKDMAVVACSQEHGFVGAEEPIPYGNLPIGSRVRILPNHACITAAAYDRYYVVDSDLDGGKSVVDVYDRINGW